MTTLIDRYLQAALELIPPRQRADVMPEIRAAIDEMVSARLDAGELETEAVRAALNALGDPAKLAASYQDRPRYLIGPAWYPAYVGVLKAVLGAVIAVVAVIAIVAGVADSDGSLGEALVDGAGAAYQVALQVLFWTTLTFVIIERTQAASGSATSATDWSVDALPSAPRERQISPGDVLPNIIMLLVFGLLVFLQNDRGVGTFVRGDFAESWDHLPLLNPDIGARWAICFFALLALSIGLEGVKCVVGAWTRPVLIMAVLESVLWIVYIAVLAARAPIFNPELAQQIDDVEAMWWEAGGSANTVVAVVIIAISLWDLWEAWRGHRRQEATRGAVSAPG